MEIFSYLDQIHAAAAKYGVSVQDAAAAEKIAFTTVWRWNRGEGSPRLATAEVILKRMKRMTNGQRRPRAG